MLKQGKGQPSVQSVCSLKILIRLLIRSLPVIGSCTKSVSVCVAHLLGHLDLAVPVWSSNAKEVTYFTHHQAEPSLYSSSSINPSAPRSTNLLNVPADTMCRPPFNQWLFCFLIAGRSWESFSRQSTTGICWLPGPSGPSDQTPRDQTSL